MSRSTPLFAVTFALAAAACSRGEPIPAAPVAAQPAPVYAPQPVYTQPAYSPSVYAPTPVAAIAAPTPLPASRPQTVAEQTPLRTALATPAPRLPSSVPAAATLSTQTPRANSTRPPARTELERLNPGMPRLVGDAPAAESPIARPRAKPARARDSGRNSGISITNSPTPTAYTSSMTTPPSIEYNIPHIPQEEPLWCWAAAAQQAIGWVNNGRAPAQCAIVAMAHGIGVEECCNDREGVCARTGEIPAIAALVRRFGGQAAESASVPRDPKEVYEILQSGATLLIRLRPAPHDAAVGIRHMIVVRGIEWLRLPNGRLEATLFYNDPLGSGYRAVSFAEIEGFFEQALIVRRNG